MNIQQILNRFYSSVLVLSISVFVYGAQFLDFRYRSVTIADGLRSNTVRHLAQDHRGFIWMGTDNGLCRYDGYEVEYYPILETGSDQYISALFPLLDGILVGTAHGAFYFDYSTEKFSRFVPQIKSEISSIAKDQDGNIWLSTIGQGVFRYHVKSRDLSHFTFKFSKNCVSQIFIDSDNQVWAIAKYGLSAVSKFNKARDCFQLRQFRAGINTSDARIIQAHNGELWFGTWNDGLYRMTDGRLVHVLDPVLTGVGKHIHTLVEMPDDKVYLGCDEGVIVYDEKTGEWNKLDFQGNHLNFIDGKFVYSILHDREGGIWIGTFYGGVVYISPIGKRFASYTNGQGGFRGSVVSHFCEDDFGHVWIASDDGGLTCLEEKTGKLITYAGQTLLSSYNVHALCIDGSDLWIGTYSNGIIRMNLISGKMKRYNERNGFDSKSCYAIYKDHLGRLWFSTMEYGILTYDRQTDRFRKVYKTAALVLDIDDDNRGNLWFSSQGAGLYRYNYMTRRWSNYRNSKSVFSIPSDQVNCLCVGDKGRLWIGSSGGLCYYNPTKDNFQRLALGQEGADVSGIVYDQGVLWLATTHGILRYERGEALRFFNRYDGLSCEVFRPNAELKTFDGRIFFGGINGFTAFYPYQISVNKMDPLVFITGFEVYNQPQKAGSKLLPKAIGYINQLDLRYSDKMFSLSFASLSYCSPEKNQYAYKLEGFDKDWNNVGNCRHATYTNLPSGTYTFRVRATNNDGVWSPHEASLTIVVHPPFWWTLPAKILYLAAVLYLVYAYTHFRLKRVEIRHQEEMRALDDRKNIEIREAHLKFFTMIAHEIRTPVTLIIGPLEQLMTHQKSDVSSAAKQDSHTISALELIDRNAHRLLYLVNQLLDFSKEQRQSFLVHFKSQDIGVILRSVVIQFQPFFRQKGIRFHVDYPPAHFSAVVDPEGITKVVSNLLMNALKYTRDTIDMSVIVADDRQGFQLVVSDNGVGISKSEQVKVFNAFYQVQSNNPGTGIGLAIVKSIVDLHHGQVQLDSELNKGTKFTITFPVNQKGIAVAHPEASTCGELGEKINAAQDEPTAIIALSDSEKSSVLIVEDDEDMQNFLTSNFRNNYIVYTASNGIEGINVLLHHTVTLIVSDWMMPEMDGVAFCRHVRADQNTSHIPFIMLTAKTDDESKTESMNCGADAYIEKPFSVKYLNACIGNLISMRKLLMKKFSDTPTEPITHIARTPLDNDFLLRMNRLIEDNIDNADLSVNFIAEKMNISRSSLFAKIKSLADVTPNEMIQIVRLRRAAQLLKGDNYRINEVCFMVGFSSPSYFAKCFQKQFGVKPTDYR
ncbi:MAG: ATP-binding protein [Prevotella sp.]|nr:hybrid sensor histidine kinase/response regulator transcription factor [Prevotella sp.]MCH3994898.1 ATP-binding protein [Prevotella sp.]